LTSITAYRDYEDTNIKDNDFSGVDVLQSNQSLPEVSLLSQELRLSGAVDMAEGRKFDWLVGGYFSHEQIQVINEFIWGSQITQFPFFAPGLFGNVPGRAFWHQFDQEIDSSAIFAQVNVGLSETVSLTLGARYSKDEKDGSLVSDHPFTNAFGAPNALPLSVVYDYDTTHEDSEPTYTATLDWQAGDNVMLFATYSRGYKSGGISMTRDAAGAALALGDPVLGCPPGFTPVPNSPFCSGPMFDPTFEREEADHVEIGLKSDLVDGRLRLNVSAWDTDFENLQTQTLRSDGAFAVVNIAGATSRGIEIESMFAATDAVNINAAIQFLDATFEDGLPALTPGFPPLGGENIPFSSETTANVGINFEQPRADNEWRFYGSANAYYRSEYFNFTEPNPALVQDGYTLLNLKLGYRNDVWDFSAWCRNCGDERVTWSNFQIPFDGLLIAPPGSSIGTRWSHVAEPRIWGVTASYRF
jgi:outer membrane receptor protein involved in Fe transport